MDKISSFDDLRVSPIPGSVKEYLQKYLKHLTDAYRCSEISRFGCVYYLSQPQDINNYADMGLTRELKETPFEFCNATSIINSHGGETCLFHGCYIFSNDFAIDIFVPESVLDFDTKKHFEENM